MFPALNGRFGRFFALLCLLPVLLAVAAPTTAQANPRYVSIVIDYATGEVLHASNADARRYPASLTKMMTLYMHFEALERGDVTADQRLHISAHAAGKPPSKLGLRAGDTIAVRETILPLVVRSANDVAAVVGEALGGSESGFAQKMTQRARELGLTSTTFKNASGLPDSGQVTTARDMAKLAVRLM